MSHPSTPSQKKRAMLAQSREHLIYHMGQVAIDSSSPLAALKRIVASEEFGGLLTRLSGMGTQTMSKILEKASQICAARKAELAEKRNAKKVANATSDGPGSSKRAKLNETDRPSDHSRGATYDESRGLEPPPSYSGGSITQILSDMGQISSGIHNSEQTRRQKRGLLSRSLMRKAEDEDDPMLDPGPDTPSLSHPVLSSHGDNDLKPSVKTEYEGSAPKAVEKVGNFLQTPGQFEDEQLHASKDPQSAYEDGGKTTNIGTAHPLEAPSAKEKALQLEAWDMYKREVGIIRRDPKVIAPIENHCCETLVDASNWRSSNPKREMGELLSDIEQLEFLFAKDQLVKYLNNRQAKLGIQSETPATWTMSEPQQVLGALRTIRTRCDDAQIHRAFGQMKLYLLVQEKLRLGYKPISSGKGKTRLPETNYLEELARKEADTVSEAEIEAKFRDYLSEHQAGKRWLQVAEWFGGPGIVLVFITAGISRPDHED